MAWYGEPKSEGDFRKDIPTTGGVSYRVVRKLSNGRRVIETIDGRQSTVATVGPEYMAKVATYSNIPGVSRFFTVDAGYAEIPPGS